MKNNKSLGQHWLKNRTVLDEIAHLAAVDTHAATCIEIGPGLGTLTSSLLRKFDQVIAVEFDERLADNLPKSFPGKNLTVINADVLKTDLVCLVPEGRPYVVVGNIPYYITSPIIRQVLNLSPRPEKVVLLIQKEVAERLAAGPGNHSVLSLMTQSLAEVEIGPVVKAEEFTPPPKVDSEVVILTPRKAALLDDKALKLIKRGFSSPRKKLTHNLAGFCGYSKAQWQEILAQGPGADVRAEDLKLSDWQKLSDFYAQ